jgi:hypothetical protein
VFVGGIRRSFGVVLLGIVAFILFSGSSAWADAKQTTGEAEASLTAHIAEERASRGLQSLRTADDLVALARQHSADMASAGHPYHDPNIRAEVQDWQVMGDNVGSGPDAEHLHTGFMNSKVHRDEILYPTYTDVGVGAFWAGNVLYVTEIFRYPMHTAIAAAAAPRPAPAPRAVTRVARAAPSAPRGAAPAPAPSTTTAPSTTALPSTTTTLPPAPEPSPPASVLAAHTTRADPSGSSLTSLALVAALLLMAVAGVQARVVRTRA